MTTTRIDVRDVDSLSAVSHVFPTGTSRCKIHILHFADGYKYVGQTRGEAASSRNLDWMRLDLGLADTSDNS